MKTIKNNENNKLTHYPRILPKPIEISKMSKAYLANQIERIQHVKVNKEYKEVLEAELKRKKFILFKILK